MERDGADNKGQVQGQVDCPGYVHIYLNTSKRTTEQVKIGKGFEREHSV